MQKFAAGYPASVYCMLHEFIAAAQTLFCLICLPSHLPICYITLDMAMSWQRDIHIMHACSTWAALMRPLTKDWLNAAAQESVLQTSLAGAAKMTPDNRTKSAMTAGCLH